MHPHNDLQWPTCQCQPYSEAQQGVGKCKMQTRLVAIILPGNSLSAFPVYVDPNHPQKNLTESGRYLAIIKNL